VNKISEDDYTYRWEENFSEYSLKLRVWKCKGTTENWTTRSFMTFTMEKYYYGDEMKAYDTGGPCRTLGLNWRNIQNSNTKILKVSDQ
jgi:hypothetical protein